MILSQKEISNLYKSGIKSFLQSMGVIQMFSGWVSDSLKDKRKESVFLEGEDFGYWFLEFYSKDEIIATFDRFESEIFDICKESNNSEDFCISNFKSMQEIKIWMFANAVDLVLDEMGVDNDEVNSGKVRLR
jgi:hypothetical protein